MLHIHCPWLAKAQVKFLTGLSHLNVVWTIWDLQNLVLFSLGLQIILMITAPFRKRTSSIFVIILVWLAYILADFIARQAIGIIREDPAESATGAQTNIATHPDLLAFWAAFLLVHLGGPDPITALALEDNELWMRTALHFCTYVAATGRIFFQSLPSNLLYLPTIFMFLVGFFKYLERALSFYYARLSKFKSSILTLDADPELISAELMDAYDSYLTHGFPDSCYLHDPNNESPELGKSSINASYADGSAPPNQSVPNMEERCDLNNRNHSREWFPSCLCRFRRSNEIRPMSNVILVRDAFVFFQKYKGLYVDLIFSLHDRNKSRAYFLKPSLTPKDAFTVIEIELNFTYEVFFTKMIVTRQELWTVIRYACFTLQVLSLLIWILFIDKLKFHGLNIRITYSLLLGAIVIDLIAFLAITLSDWKVATLNKKSKMRVYLYDKLLSARSQTSLLLKRIFFRRWSESIFQFNLIYYSSIHPWSRPPYIPEFLNTPIREYYEWYKCVSKISFDNDLRDFIFAELKYRAEIGDDPKDASEICDSKGDWFLRTLAGSDFDAFVFNKWTVDVEYDKCLLLWHIAAELLYRQKDNSPTEEETHRKGANQSGMAHRKGLVGSTHSSPVRTPNGPSEENYREYCKILSHYMMYLMKWQSGMMSDVAGTSEVRFRHTCGKLTVLFEKLIQGNARDGMLEPFCDRIMKSKESVIDTQRGRNKSVLLDAVHLAKMLKEMKLEGVGKWELIAKVWVDLVGYSATRCRASVHLAQLKQGGELLTLVWLMMVHLGLGKQFSITEDDK